MNVKKVVSVIFFCVGCIALFIGLFSIVSTKDFLKKATSVDGVVIEMIRIRDDEGDYLYKPVVAFTTLQGEEIKLISSVASSPPRYSEGETVQVLYLQSKPQKAKLAGSLWLDSFILLILGSAFTFVGSIMGIIRIKKCKTLTWLKKHGTPIKAKFQSVEKNTSISANGKHPYRIYAQWLNPNTSEIHVFKSVNLWFDPKDYIKQEELMILIDYNNPKKYYMDISFLPKLAK